MNFRHLLNRISLFCLALFLALSCLAQTKPASSGEKDRPRPYKILTNGKQITIQSAGELESVMVWTAGGHRMLEDRAIHKKEYRFNLTVVTRIYFIMIRMKDGKTYSEKMGVSGL